MRCWKSHRSLNNSGGADLIVVIFISSSFTTDLRVMCTYYLHHILSFNFLYMFQYSSLLLHFIQVWWPLLFKLPVRNCCIIATQFYPYIKCLYHLKFTYQKVVWKYTNYLKLSEINCTEQVSFCGHGFIYTMLSLSISKSTQWPSWDKLTTRVGGKNPRPEPVEFFSRHMIYINISKGLLSH